MDASAPTPGPVSRAPRVRLSLTHQILLGLVLGVLVGWWVHGLSAEAAKPWITWLVVPRDIFLHLIKAMIAPLIFATVVQGMGGVGDTRRVGRVGAKAVAYFAVMTVLALAVGMIAANVFQPGAGVVLPAEASTAGLARPKTMAETLVHMFPTSVLDAMARNDVLQIVVFSVLFAAAVIAAGDAGRPVLAFCGSLAEVMLKFAELIMRFAPIGVGAAIAVTVAQQGIASMVDLGELVLTLYVGLAVFALVVFGGLVLALRIPIRPFLTAVREPFTIAFATANSEAALPKAFAAMERFGVPPGIVGFVLPAGYSFNLAGSTLHLAVASLFVAQAAASTSGVVFGFEQQLALMAMLAITSKGVAAVPRASFVVLIAALQSFHLPLAGAFLILGVDALLDMARTSINVLGNCLGTAVVAKWEGELKSNS